MSFSAPSSVFCDEKSSRVRVVYDAVISVKIIYALLFVIFAAFKS